MTKPLCAVLAILLFLSTGCWSRREMNDLGVVVTLGVDLTESGLIEVTMAIAQPAAASGGAMGQTGQPGQPGEAAKAVVTRTGRTLSEAIREAELIVPRRLTLQHAQVILLGERLADGGVDTLLDFLLRNPAVRLSTRMVVLKGASIKEVLGTPPIVEKLQAQVLRELASSRVGLIRSLKDFMVARSSPHQAPVLPVITFEGEFFTGSGVRLPSPELTGVTVFRDDRAVEYIDAEKSRGVIWLIGSARDSIVTVECPGTPGKYVSARIYGADRDIQPVWKGSKLGFVVSVGGTVHITETQCGLDLLDLSTMQQVEVALRKRIKERVEDAVKITQDIPADPFSFGEYVRARMPRVWDRVGQRWAEEWATTSVQIEVRVKAVHVENTTKVPNWRPYPSVTR